MAQNSLCFECGSLFGDYLEIYSCSVCYNNICYDCCELHNVYQTCPQCHREMCQSNILQEGICWECKINGED